MARCSRCSKSVCCRTGDDCRIGVQGAPEQPLSSDSKSETLQGLKQAQAGSVTTGEAEFRATEFLRQPRAGVARVAICDAESGH